MFIFYKSMKQMSIKPRSKPMHCLSCFSITLPFVMSSQDSFTQILINALYTDEGAELEQHYPIQWRWVEFISFTAASQ